MYRAQKRHIKVLMSVGVLILGIGFIFWATYHIFGQAEYAELPVFFSTSYSDSSMPVDQSHANSIKNSTGTPAVTRIWGSTTYNIQNAGMDSNLYIVYPQEGELIGSLSIPALNKVLPILEGTGTNELSQGVGHFSGSALPGEANNCVLSGHRNTVFVGLGSLKIGDQLIIETVAGIFTYQINGVKIVEKDDRTIIVSMDSATLILTTCHPFIFVGYAPQRYIIYANLIDG